MTASSLFVIQNFWIKNFRHFELLFNFKNSYQTNEAIGLHSQH